MKRRHGEISGVLEQLSTGVSTASEQQTSVQDERPDKRARLSSTLATSTVLDNKPYSNQPVLSARAKRLANIQGEVGSDDKPKDIVRHNMNGSLDYYSKDNMTWVSAVYHNNLRSELIDEAAREGQYIFPREPGLGLTDITSFLPSQKSWGPERVNWPEILFQPKPNTTKDVGQGIPLWYRGGRLVLDQDNHPMREFSGILPTTYSSHAEGWLVEATYRCNNSIHLQDIRGRMPRDIVVVRKRLQVTEPLFTLRTISQRTGRFRRTAGLAARHTRGGSDNINAGLEKVLSAECLERNSTKDLNRVLTPAEAKALTNLNKGRYPQRGRNKSTASALNPASAKEPEKRKRTVTASDPAYLTMGEEGKTAKKARRAGHLQSEMQSVLTQGPGTRVYSPELLAQEGSFPGYPDPTFFDPTSSSSAYPDPTLFEPRNPHFVYHESTLSGPLDGFNSNEFTHAPGGHSFIYGQTYGLRSLQSLGHETAYSTPSVSHPQVHGWNPEGHSFQNYRSRIHTQAYYPQEASCVNHGSDAGRAFTQERGITYSQTYQTTVASPSWHQEGDLGHRFGEDIDQIPGPGSGGTGETSPIHGRNDLDVAAQTTTFVEPRAEYMVKAFHGDGNQIHNLEGDGHLEFQIVPIPLQDFSMWLNDEEVERICREVFSTT